jgi:hypothetical protein
MSRRTGTLTAVALCLAAALALPTAASAQAAEAAPAATDPPDAPRLEGDLERWPPVTLALKNAAPDEALAAIAGKLGLDFVSPATVDPDAPRITLALKKRPGREALATLLEVTGRRAAIRGGMLVVSADAEVDSREPERDGALRIPEIFRDPAPEPTAAPEPAAAPPPAAAPTPASPAAAAAAEPPPNADHGGKRRELVRFGEPLRVEAGEVVDEAVAFGGPLTVAGTVRGDTVAFGGPLTLEPTAVVEGDAVVFGGPLEVKPGAVVRGDRVGFGGTLGDVVGGIAGAAGREVPPWQLAVLGIVSAFVKCAVLLLVGLLVLTFMPERYVRVREQLVRRPGRSALAGFLMMLALVPLAIVLAVTVIGIPLIPIAGLFLFVLMGVGMTAFATWLGDRLPILKGRKSQFVALALGTAVVFLVSIVPFVGAVAIAAVAFIAAGAALLSKLGAPPKDAAPAAGPADASPATL